MVTPLDPPALDQPRPDLTPPTGRVATRRRVCVVSEVLSGAPDEGLKKFTLSVGSALLEMHDVTCVSTAAGPPLPGVHQVPAPRTFLSPRLRSVLVEAAPHVLIYAARSSTTLMTFARARVLKAYCPGASVVVLGFQARRHSVLQQRLIRRLTPDLVCVQSPASKEYLEALGCQAVLIPSGVDLGTFHPVDLGQRRALRAEHHLLNDIPVVLHVGHLQPGRNIRILADLAARGTCQVVLVTSSSLEQQPQLAHELRAAGVVVITSYVPRIEQLYQLADCYLFTVESSNNAIEVPLSVLEALACDLPVVTTRFGGLPALFEQHPRPGLVFADSTGDLLDAAERLALSGVRGTRSLAAPYAWPTVASRLVQQALSRRRSRD